MKKYLEFDDLEIYQIARSVSASVWNIYSDLDMDQKIMFG